jgi:hypothetical protein
LHWFGVATVSSPNMEFAAAGTTGRTSFIGCASSGL